MGMQTMQVQQPMQQGGGKGSASQVNRSLPQIGGQGAGQPRFGQPNQYSNTVSPWDNATIAPQYSFGGKGGKGGGMQSNYPTANTNWNYSLSSNTTQQQPQQTASNVNNVDFGGY